MNNPLFFPESLQEQLISLQDAIQSYKPDENLLNYLIGIDYIDPTNDLYNCSKVIQAQSNLLTWYESLNHYFSEPELGMHPKFHDYVLHWDFVPVNQKFMPKPVREIMDMPHNGSTISSYTTITRGTHLITWVDKDATIEQCLETLQEWERISDWVSREYDGALRPYEESIWEILDIHGDDSVDYQSSYLDSVIQFFRAYLYLKTQDERFIK